MAFNSASQMPSVMRGESYEDCVKKIRDIYGRDYQIIRREEVAPEGFFGFLKKKQYAVTYTPVPPSMYRAPAASAPLNFEEERRKILEAGKDFSNPQMKLVLDEIRSLRRDLDEKTAAQNNEHPTVSKIQELMRKNEFTGAYIKNITEKIRKEYSLEDLDDFEKVQKSTVDWIGESIKIADTDYTSFPQVIVLVGPTGVGKTTSVAKLAASYIVDRGTVDSSVQRVRIITTDVFRIGGHNQLETYGGIMHIPVSVADSTEDMQKLLRLYSNDVDIIFIDTTGHSPKDYEGLARMRKVLDFKGIRPHVFLTVSASTKVSDLRTILQQYEIFGYDALIITKMDETDCIGSIISVMDEKGKSLAYFTDGQRVPRDLEKANPVRMLIQLADFKIDREHIDRKFLPKG